MTAYNREQYISEAIESVLYQTYTNFELIVVDDASIDNTCAIVESYQCVDNRIKLFKNSINLGDYPNRNRAFSYANGELIVFLDSDDTFNSDALQYIVDSFELHSTAQHSTIYYGNISNPLLMNSDVSIKRHFFNDNMLSCGPSARVFKKNFYKSMGGYPEIYGPANDMYFNIKTVAATPILILPYSYLNYRIHQGQERNKLYNYIYHGYNYFQDIMLLPELPLSKKDKSFLIKKNKRRLIVNSLKYFFKTLNIYKTLNLFKLAKFSFSDFVQGCLG